MILFLIVGTGAVVLACAVRHTSKLRAAVTQGAKAHTPTAISAIVLMVQASELVSVVQHATLVNLSAAGLLLAIMLATKSGTEKFNR